MTKRLTASLLLVVWLFVFVAPLASAGTVQHCPICRTNVCPMHKTAPKDAKMSCHEEKSEANCSLRAAACEHNTSIEAFSFDALLPDVISLWQQSHAILISTSLRPLILSVIRTDTPPPKSV